MWDAEIQCGDDGKSPRSVLEVEVCHLGTGSITEPASTRPTHSPTPYNNELGFEDKCIHMKN